MRCPVTAVLPSCSLADEGPSQGDGKFLQFDGTCPNLQSSVMKRPLTLCLYEKLLPGGQLVNRLQDLGYRVQSLSDPKSLVEHAEREKPLVVIADLEPRQNQVCEAI